MTFTHDIESTYIHTVIILVSITYQSLNRRHVFFQKYRKNAKMTTRPTTIILMMGYFGIKGIVMFGILAMIHALLAQMPPYAMLNLGWFVIIIDALIISVAIIQFFMCYILYTGKNWGRYVIIGLTAYTIINGILNVLTYGSSAQHIPIAGILTGLSTIFLILDFGVMYMMFRPEIRKYFRKPKVDNTSGAI